MADVFTKLLLEKRAKTKKNKRKKKRKNENAYNLWPILGIKLVLLGDF